MFLIISSDKSGKFLKIEDTTSTIEEAKLLIERKKKEIKNQNLKYEIYNKSHEYNDDLIRSLINIYNHHLVMEIQEDILFSSGYIKILEDTLDKLSLRGINYKLYKPEKLSKENYQSLKTKKDKALNQLVHYLKYKCLPKD